MNTKPQRPQSFYTKFSERMFEVHDFVFFVFHFPGFRNFQLVSQGTQSFSLRSQRGFCNPCGHCVSSRSLRYIIRLRRPQRKNHKVHNFIFFVVPSVLCVPLLTDFYKYRKERKVFRKDRNVDFVILAAIAFLRVHCDT